MATDASAIAHALAEAATAINSAHNLDETLEAIARAARHSVPGIDHAGISVMHRSGRIETKAATDQLVWDLDALQYRLNEGPCVTAIRDQPVVVVEHARHEQRWPRYMAGAVRAGLQAQLAVQLYTNERSMGGLNLYSTTSETIEDQAVDIAQMFATHAAIALGHAHVEADLGEGMRTRQLIGQAVGLVMCRYQIDSDRAFQYLVRAASSSNTKLRVIAAEVAADADRSYRTKAEARSD